MPISISLSEALVFWTILGLVAVTALSASLSSRILQGKYVLPVTSLFLSSTVLLVGVYIWVWGVDSLRKIMNDNPGQTLGAVAIFVFLGVFVTFRFFGLRTTSASVVDNDGVRSHSVRVVTEDTTVYVPLSPLAPAPSSHQVPFLPARYLLRKEVLADIKALVLTEKSSATQGLGITVLHGLGGVGKSTLAQAIAHDPEVMKHFPERLWAPLGQQPDLLSVLSTWIQALGDWRFAPSSVESASAHLRTLLIDSTKLLVVDDAWSPNDVEPFRVGGPNCHLLVTTREALVGEFLGVNPYPVDVLTPEEALELIQIHLGRSLAHDELTQAASLSRMVGYLPLALELATKQVADGMSWQALEAALTAEIAHLEALDPPEVNGITDSTNEAARKQFSLVATFNLSLRVLRPAELRCFAWLGILAEDATITVPLTSTVWDVSTSDAQQTLRLFRRKAILQLAMPMADGAPTYRIHDLLYDRARSLIVAPAYPSQSEKLSGLGLTIAEAHAVLLQRYEAQLVRDSMGTPLWSSVPNDGYIHMYLTWHMEQAGMLDRIHELLSEETDNQTNGWYEARTNLGQEAGFLEDVARAWRIIEEE